MRGIHPVAAVVLCAAAAAAAFAVGRSSAPREPASLGADLGEATREALGAGDALDRVARTSLVLERLDRENLPQVQVVYDEMLPVLGQWEIRPFLAAWARFDPAGALDHAMRWPYRSKREFAVEAAMEGWALRDPVAARAVYDELAAGRPALRQSLLLGLVAGWVHSGQGGLDGYLATLPPATRDAATSIAAGALVRRGGAEAALGWADGILRDDAQEDDFKRSVFRRATRTVARLDPERGAAWVLEHGDSGYAADGAWILAEQWGAQDGRAALAWIAEHTSGTSGQQAAREAFVQWLKADPTAAAAWLAAADPAELNDPAFDAYARRLDDREPQEAIRWCGRILDPVRRTGCLKTAAIRWYQRDPVAAEAWLQESALDEGARAQVRRSPPPERARGRRNARPAR